MAVRVGINGFGRIGRISLRAIIERYRDDIEVVALNDLTEVTTNAYLFQHDSVYGNYRGDVTFDDDSIQVAGYDISVFKEKDPASIPWDKVGVDIVVESTGVFTDATKAAAHRERGVKKVIISAPAKNEDATLLLGVNEDVYDPAKHHVVSNASCTTNGLAPVAKVLHDKFGVQKGLLTTVHAYTNSQALVDTVKKDLRDSRSGALNVVPSSTGAAKAVGLVIPELKGRFTGMAFRVPVPTVSVVDFTALLSRAVSVEEINAAMKEYAEGKMKGILRYTEEQLVSSDLQGDPHSSIFSAADTIALEDMVKCVAWYDNEWGYSCRIADLIKFMANKGL
ncbi:MAG: type I glyceraldehyde-3-phosphate dehydrogenase [Fimbriimonadaceae bacterium]|nr:type I glyceraldehyde-3-phosphate dehydrogenase [Fimbriimonadaceae bacterium]QYK56783.1 MAG: type I glyceraldehyde-3-phosphate dehydrogenase [Fimbriimonadaceae bacterium]